MQENYSTRKKNYWTNFQKARTCKENPRLYKARKNYIAVVGAHESTHYVCQCQRDLRIGTPGYPSALGIRVFFVSINPQGRESKKQWHTTYIPMQMDII